MYRVGWKAATRKRFSRITRPFWRRLAVTMIPMQRRFIDSWWPITFYEDRGEKDYMFIDDFEQTHSVWWLYSRILPRMTLFSDQCSQHHIYFTPQNCYIHTQYISQYSLMFVMGSMISKTPSLGWKHRLNRRPRWFTCGSCWWCWSCPAS